jgi:hypothetical protein
MKILDNLIGMRLIKIPKVQKQIILIIIKKAIAAQIPKFLI